MSQRTTTVTLPSVEFGGYFLDESLLRPGSFVAWIEQSDFGPG